MLEERGYGGAVWQAGTFEFSLRYPVSGGWRSLAWCAILMFLSSLIVPPFAVLGYAHHVGRSAVYGSLESPKFGSFLGRVVDGVKVVTVFLVLGVAFFAGGWVVLDVSETGVLSETEVGYVLIVFLGVLTYVLNGFLTVHAATDSLFTTFTTYRVVGFVSSAYYLKAWLFQFVVLGGVFVVGVMTAVTVFGILFWIPFAMIVFTSYWGRIYKQAMDRGIVEPVNVDV